jgi:hypothetical protein
VTLVIESSFKKNRAGSTAFAQEFNPRRQLLIGENGIPLKEFLLTPISSLF